MISLVSLVLGGQLFIYSLSSPSLALDGLVLKNKFQEHGYPTKLHDLFVCIADKESNRVPKTIRYNNNGSIDRGILQVNSVHLETCNMTGKELLQVDNNLKCGLVIYRKQGLRAWASLHKCGG